MDRPQYLNWFVQEENVVFEDSEPLTCYKLSFAPDEAALEDWALHIRRHYVPDYELTDDAASHALTIEDYLREFVIPQKKESFGPTARSNDFSEILFSDLFEFLLNFEVPRCKQYNRSGKNESEHGTDIIAFKFFKNAKEPSRNDELVAIEVKARLSSSEACAVIKDAADDSKKDEHRVAHTLNYYRKKLRSMGRAEEAESVARFQQKVEKPYKLSYVGAAISSLPDIKGHIIVGIKGTELELKTNQSIVYVHGEDLMSLAHQVFERCTR